MLIAGHHRRTALIELLKKKSDVAYKRGEDANISDNDYVWLVHIYDARNVTHDALNSSKKNREELAKSDSDGYTFLQVVKGVFEDRPVEEMQSLLQGQNL